jgi:hypothetical protein
MSVPQPWYVGLRARSYAVLWLTQRDDLRVVYQSSPASGVDMLVTVLREGHFSGRQFGVVLAPRRAGVAPPRLDARTVAHERATYAEATFPVCMLAFSANSENGWFRWIVAPEVRGDGDADLELSTQIHFEATTEELLDRVVDEVNQWYDARSGSS